MERTGFIKAILPQGLQIEVVQNSACGNCQSGCGMAETRTEIFNVDTPLTGGPFQVGEQVVLSIPTPTGMKAVGWAYLVPTLIVLFTLFSSYGLTQNEILSGLLALAALLPYFLYIHLRRSCLQNDLKISVHKIT